MTEKWTSVRALLIAESHEILLIQNKSPYSNLSGGLVCGEAPV